MAQPIKIQNEPSMDEILASIRRIIEDSEPLPAAPKAGANDDAAVSPRAEPMPQPRADATQPARTVAGEPVRLSADLAHELDRVAATPAATPRPAPPKQADRPILGESLAAGDTRAALDAIHKVAAEPERRMQKPAAPAHEAAPVQAARVPILSDKAGRQVAAAFEELSEAYAQSRLRSFEEMAEEMLRPMLRDWLDNNLPGLVERLVREEIDRVARGAPR